VSDPVPFTCHCDDGYPVAVLRPCGVLTFATAPIVRHSALKALTSRPDVLLVDVSGLESGDDITLTAFPALRRQAEMVDVSMMLIGPSPTLLASLGSMAVTRTVASFASAELALAADAASPAPRRMSRLVLPGPEAGAEVRDVIDRSCETWGLAHLADTAALIATELAANVVRHARTEFVFTTTRRTRHLHLSAQDHCLDQPRRRVPDEAGTGRGLLIIEGLAAAWGSVPTSDGKVVWATLRMRPER
jgi:anti-anti-sigma regulatory factor